MVDGVGGSKGNASAGTAGKVSAPDVPNDPMVKAMQQALQEALQEASRRQ
jgi:hypothetical protein